MKLRLFAQRLTDINTGLAKDRREPDKVLTYVATIERLITDMMLEVEEENT